MNGRRGFSQCSGCGEIGKYGSRPKHKGSCLDASKEWDKDCICGHWCGHHMGPGATKDKPDGTTWGCNLEGCRCELNYIEASNVQSKAENKCECGATSALGAPIGSPLHSHYGYSDPSRWCPARKAK